MCQINQTWPNPIIWVCTLCEVVIEKSRSKDTGSLRRHIGKEHPHKYECACEYCFRTAEKHIKDTKIRAEYRRKIDDHNSSSNSCSSDEITLSKTVDESPVKDNSETENCQNFKNFETSFEKSPDDLSAKRKITDFFESKLIKKQKKVITIDSTDIENFALSTEEKEQPEEPIANDSNYDLDDDLEIDPQADCENVPLIWEKKIRTVVNDSSGKNILEEQTFIDFLLSLEDQNSINLFNLDLFCSINEQLGLKRSKKFENSDNNELAKEEREIKSKYGYCLYEECQSSSCKKNRLKRLFCDISKKNTDNI